MHDLNFQVDGAEPLSFAAAPHLVFKLRMTDAGDGQVLVSAITLQCQIRIEPTKRRYEPPEQERLLDLFGEPHRWGQTLRSLLWAHTSLVVPTFQGTTVVDLPVPCTYDFNIATTKYFSALDDGEVPLRLLFSGTVFFTDEDGGLQVSQIPWDKEANFRLPIRTWKDMMELYYPNCAWLCLPKNVFDRLSQYKRRHGLATWEQALESLLTAINEPVER